MDIEDIIRVTSAAEVFIEHLTAADHEDSSIEELRQSIERVLDVVRAFDVVYLLGQIPDTPAAARNLN